MKITNTLTGQKEELSSKSIGMYACGPTVYDEPHIGHLRSAYVFDVARRVLRDLLGYKVKFVRNVTDVDDKIIDRARQDKMPTSEITAKYLKAYHDTLNKFGIEAPDHEPKAIAHIADMQKLIGTLIQKGLAYASAGSVYFRVRQFKPYGDLSHRKNLDELYLNTRKEAGEGKDDPFDFALWKKAEDEPNWDSPWGKGRPGWHIECSAMSSKYLGDEFEIHGGGLDLLFPHHENERAQSMAAAGKKFARIWMHHGLVTVNGQKMSKSLKNYVTLDKVLEKHSPDVLKVFFLQSHYRSDVDFTWSKLAALQEAIATFLFFFKKSDATKGKGNSSKAFDAKFKDALSDDFDTPKALSVLFEALDEANRLLSSAQKGDAADIGGWILERGRLIGIFLGINAKASWNETLQELEALRNEKRIAQQYHVSDFIRRELLNLGFQVEDNKSRTLSISTSCLISEDTMSAKLSNLLRQAKEMK